MTKTELISKVADECGLTKAKASKVVDVVFDALVKSLKRKERTTINGFGTFTTITKKARTGRNPKTGEEVKIPARTTAVWRPAKELKDIK